MIKKIMTTFLALTMVFSMSSVSFADSTTSNDTTSYGVFIGGVEITSDNASDVKGTGIIGKVSYNPNTATLTLSNATIEGTYKQNGPGPYGEHNATYFGLYANHDIEVKLIGSNKITHIIKGGEIDFTGSGTINVECPGGYYYEDCTAINCDCIYVGKGTTVNVINNKRTQVCGIKTDLVVVEGKLKITSCGTQDCDGIIKKNTACEVDITETGSIQIKASVNSSKSTFSGRSACGIYAGTKGSINNLGSLNVTTSGGKDSAALTAKEVVLVNGSTTTLCGATKAMDVTYLYPDKYITCKAGTSSSAAYAAKASAAFYQKYFKAGKKLGGKVKPTTLKSLTKAKKAMTVKWNKRPSYFVNGYQIQYSTSSKFKSGNKTVTVKGSSITSKKITKLKSKKKYYVRIRTYRVSGTTKYSSWSSKKYVTTK